MSVCLKGRARGGGRQTNRRRLKGVESEQRPKTLEG